MTKARLVIGSYCDQLSVIEFVSRCFVDSIKNVKWWSLGKISKKKLELFLSEMSINGANEISFQLKCGKLFCFPSPLMHGWGDLSGLGELCNQDVQRVRSYRSFENSLKINFIERYPVTFVYEGDDVANRFNEIADITANGIGDLDFIWLLGERATQLFEPLTYLAPKPFEYQQLDKFALGGADKAYLRKIDSRRVLLKGNFEEIIV